MRIRMLDFEENDVFAGALAGRKALGFLIERIGIEPDAPEPVYLDFAGIEVATASYLRECVLGFRDIVRTRWTTYYPVVANATEAVTEELSVLLEQKRDVLMLCSLDGDGVPHSRRLVGELEPKQRITFDLVNRLGEADAGELMSATKSSETVGQTAWNNRLAMLSKLGLLMETSHGRAKRYRPLPIKE